MPRYELYVPTKVDHIEGLVRCPYQVFKSLHRSLVRTFRVRKLTPLIWRHTSNERRLLSLRPHAAPGRHLCCRFSVIGAFAESCGSTPSALPCADCQVRCLVHKCELDLLQTLNPQNVLYYYQIYIRYLF